MRTDHSHASTPALWPSFPSGCGGQLAHTFLIWGVKLLLELLAQQPSLSTSLCPFFLCLCALWMSLAHFSLPSHHSTFPLSYLSAFVCNLTSPSHLYHPPVYSLLFHWSDPVAMATSCFASLSTHSTSLCPWAMSLTCILPSINEASISCDHPCSVCDQWARLFLKTNSVAVSHILPCDVLVCSLWQSVVWACCSLPLFKYGGCLPDTSLTTWLYC